MGDNVICSIACKAAESHILRHAHIQAKDLLMGRDPRCDLSAKRPLSPVVIPRVPQRLRNLFEHGHNEFTDGVHLTRPIAEYRDDMIALVSEELVPEVRLPLEVIVFVEIGVKLLRRTLQEALERPRDP